MIKLKDNNNLFGVVESETPEINRTELGDCLYEYLSKITLEEFADLITNRFIETIEYANLCIGKKSCQKTSLLFNPHRLNTASKNSSKSLYAALKDRSFVDGLSRAMIFKNGKVKELLYQVMQLGINGTQYINEFPPHVARDIAYHYKLSSGSKILDPCGGWGGRMVGFSVVSDNYECYEPATCTAKGLLCLAEFIKSFRNSFTAKVNVMPFEDANIETGFDFALTSPPYYDIEVYSDEKTNSLNRYKTYSDWVDGFYAPLINKTMAALRPGSYFVLNIGSRKYPLNKELKRICHNKYSMRNTDIVLSGKAGLGKSGEGETFYEIRKD